MPDAVRVEGLASLRTSLRKLEHIEERREVTGALREGAVVVAAAARPLVQNRVEATTSYRPGALAASYRPGASGNKAFVRSRLPYAGVQEFGGVIRPKGTPITIKAQEPLTRALEMRADSIVDKVSDALDAVFRAAGWR